MSFAKNYYLHCHRDRNANGDDAISSHFVHRSHIVHTHTHTSHARARNTHNEWNGMNELNGYLNPHCLPTQGQMEHVEHVNIVNWLNRCLHVINNNNDRDDDVE